MSIGRDRSSRRGLYVQGSSIVVGGSRSRRSGSGLVGLDAGTETELVGNILNMTRDAVNISERVRSLLVVVGIGNLVARLLGAVLIDGFIAEAVWLRGVRNVGLSYNGGGGSVVQRSGMGIS